MDENLAVRSLKRLIYAFVGLLAGDAILLLFLLQNALRSRAVLLAAHMGQPGLQVSLAFQMFVIYMISSFLGWLFVGLPIALFLPAHSIVRLAWPLKLLIGVALGPLALFIIFFLLGHGRISFPASFTGTSVLWVYAILVSTVSFAVYAALLRREAVGGVK